MPEVFIIVFSCDSLGPFCLLGVFNTLLKYYKFTKWTTNITVCWCFSLQQILHFRQTQTQPWLSQVLKDLRTSTTGWLTASTECRQNGSNDLQLTKTKMEKFRHLNCTPTWHCWTGGKTYSWTDRETDIQTDTAGQVERHTVIQTDRQTDRQTVWNNVFDNPRQLSIFADVL